MRFLLVDDSLLELEVQNLKELLRINSLNEKLLDANHNLMLRIIQKYRIPIDAETLALLSETKRVLHEINASPEIDHGFGNTRRFNKAQI